MYFPNEVKLQGEHLTAGTNYFLSVRGCKGFLCLENLGGPQLNVTPFRN